MDPEPEPVVAETPKSMILVSMDGVRVTISHDAARHSSCLMGMLDCVMDVEDGHTISPIDGPVLKKIVEFMEHYKDLPIVEANDWRVLSEIDDDERKKWTTFQDVDLKEHVAWNKEFVTVDEDVLMDIFKGANFLGEVSYLLHVCAAKMAETLKNMTPEEIRAKYSLPDDLTDEEKEQIKNENQYCSVVPSTTKDFSDLVTRVVEDKTPSTDKEEKSKEKDAF